MLSSLVLITMRNRFLRTWSWKNSKCALFSRKKAQSIKKKGIDHFCYLISLIIFYSSRISIVSLNC